MIYAAIALFASLIGATSGLGGGVIIKPVLDLISGFDAGSISLLSAFTVLAMAAASLIRQFFYKTKIEYRLGIMLSAGAFAGGYIGNFLFNTLLRLWGNSAAVTLFQNLLLSLLLIAVLLYMNTFKNKKSCILHNPAIIIFTGTCLGALSSFIGIGGGPINMLVLTSLFSMHTKEAAVNSLLLVFFSQGAKILTVGLTSGFAAYELTVLWLMLPAGIIGGLLGAWLNKRAESKYIMRLFNLTNLAIIGISIFNSAQIIFELM